MNARPTGRTRLRRWLLRISAISAAWTTLLIFTGGIYYRTDLIRISSRNWHLPFALSILLLAVAWLISTADEWRETVRHARARLDPLAQLPNWVAPAMASAIALTVVVVGVRWGIVHVAGADTYGYVSQAHRWAAGEILRQEPLAPQLRSRSGAKALAPLGYHFLGDGLTTAPDFPPGYPLMMAVFELAAGRSAVYWVVPLLAAVTVGATYAMGRRLGGRAAGLMAAVLMATSPTFVMHLLMPMTDVPVTALWASCLALLVSPGRAAALGGGVAAGLAVLTRLNLAPLMLVPALFLAIAAGRDRSLTGITGQRLGLYVVGLLPGCVTAGVINAFLFGSPLTSGLAGSTYVFSLANVGPNLLTYPAWLLSTQTPLVLLAPLTPWVVHRPNTNHPPSQRITAEWLTFAAAVLGCYLLYLPHDSWIWLRYLLPAFPPLFALTATAFTRLASPLGRGVRLAAIAGLLILIFAHTRPFRDGLFNMRYDNKRMQSVADDLARATPDRSIFLAVHHSGSIPYYSGRSTLLYALIPASDIDALSDELAAMGYQVSAVLEPTEEQDFRQRFAGTRAASALDRPGRKAGDLGDVRVFDISGGGNGQQTTAPANPQQP
jgi:hypothetical protein